MKTIVRMQFGSHLYGTDTPLSDFDYKTVFTPPARDILLQRVTDAYRDQREKAPGEKNQAGEAEEEFYSVQKFLTLLAEGQTNTIDMIFAPKQMLLEVTPIWCEIVSNRHRFLTRRAAAFVGYCRQQANKYGIRGSRVAATRAARDLFDALMKVGGASGKLSDFAVEIRAFASMTDHCSIVELAPQRGGKALEHFECCNRKAPFTITLHAAWEMYSRLFNDYGERAKRAEQSEGIDWKALSHAVRVGREALDLLAAGEIVFPLPYRDHIRAIKTGEMAYTAVAAEIEELLARVEAAAETSTLPFDPDREWMDDFVSDIHARVISGTI